MKNEEGISECNRGIQHNFIHWQSKTHCSTQTIKEYFEFKNHRNLSWKLVVVLHTKDKINIRTTATYVQFVTRQCCIHGCCSLSVWIHFSISKIIAWSFIQRKMWSQKMRQDFSRIFWNTKTCREISVYSWVIHNYASFIPDYIAQGTRWCVFVYVSDQTGGGFEPIVNTANSASTFNSLGFCFSFQRYPCNKSDLIFPTNKWSDKEEISLN